MVLALVETDDGEPTDTSLQALTLARGLAAETDSALAAAAFEDARGVADDLADFGVSTVHAVDHERLDGYAPVAWAATLGQLVDAADHGAVVAPGSDRGQEVLAHLAARRDLPMAANCLEVAPGEPYELTRQRWGGSLLEHATLAAETKLLTVAEHEVAAEPAATPADATVDAFAPEFSGSELRVSVDRYEESDLEGVPLGEARVVVGGGRGVGSGEDFDKLEELADVLGGTVGSSRAAVNEGWRPHDDQIGLTGAKITPEVYIACGISGAVQHMVGAKGSKNIVAINTDPEAAIIQKGDYAVIGDLHEVVPALTEAIRDAR